MNSNKKIAVAFSGGIDSSVCAYLMQAKGYDVVAITAKMVNDEYFDTVAEKASEVAKKLGVEHHIIDLSEDFEREVISYFKESYASGYTPNPCVKCNKHIKWGKILDYAINELKADYFATGHYAKLVADDDRYLLYPAKDIKKDQLYYLSELTQEQLSKTLFPLGNMLKSNVRTVAEENNLPSASSKESQDVCFIKAPMNTKTYIEQFTEPKEGSFVHYQTGEKLGTHNGFYSYTIGQRKGIGVAYTEALYVISIDYEKNIVYLGPQKELYRTKVLVNQINWHDDRYKLPFEAMVKIRYNMEAKKALITPSDDLVLISFYEPVLTPARGQNAVFYDFKDGHLIGGGWVV